MRVSNVYLYAEPRCAGVDFEAIADYLSQRLGSASIELRGPFFSEGFICRMAPGLDAAKMIAGARVRSPVEQRVPGVGTLDGEVEYERRRLSDAGCSSYGILYDAEEIAYGSAAFLPRNESGYGHVHLIFTNQLIGSWDCADKRYHARAVLCGSPALVSTTGVAEAPAKDRSYYLAMKGAAFAGLGRQQQLEVARGYCEDFLTAEDPRMTEVLKGYAMQVIAYRETGEPFCADSSCRLFNAHWQHEVLKAQLGGEYEYCERHRKKFGGGA